MKKQKRALKPAPRGATIGSVLKRCSAEPNETVISEVKRIDNEIKAGASFQELQGCILKANKTYVRFKVGMEYRLIYQFTTDGFVPVQLLTRQKFDRWIRKVI